MRGLQDAPREAEMLPIIISKIPELLLQSVGQFIQEEENQTPPLNRKMRQELLAINNLHNYKYVHGG